ncbi:MAG: SDR family oxidoreductase [Fibrobacteria bacterium]|nr:SDR family oxidoreductase [Fibrobacteria bacterium]
MAPVIAITGASRGVGEDLVRHFISQNWITIGLSRNTKKLSELQTELGNNFFYYELDVSSGDNVNKIFKQIKKKFNRINAFVNNAAIFKWSSLEKCTDSDINSIIDTNLKGSIFTIRSAIKQKCFCKGGRIINISSVAGLHGIEGQAIYSASKFGLKGFSEAVGQELLHQKILLTTIYPGGINTPLWNKKNEYPGDTSQLLKPGDITSTIDFIVHLPNNVYLKDITIFPTNEWH